MKPSRLTLLAALLGATLSPSASATPCSGDPLPLAPATPAVLPVAPASPAMWSRNPDVRVELFYEDFELGSLEYEPSIGPHFRARDVERRRGGVRVAFGDEQFSGYVTAFGETWKDPFIGASFHNFGMGGGLTGQPVVGRLRRGGKLLIPYRVGISFVGGYEEVDAADYFLYYGEFEGEFGVAVNYSGFQPSAGLYFTTLSGGIETDLGFARRTEHLYGFNGGAYAELKYDNRRSPIYGRLRGVIGDVEGVSLGLGIKF